MVDIAILHKFCLLKFFCYFLYVRLDFLTANRKNRNIFPLLHWCVFKKACHNALTKRASNLLQGNLRKYKFCQVVGPLTSNFYPRGVHFVKKCLWGARQGGVGGSLSHSNLYSSETAKTKTDSRMKACIVAFSSTNKLYGIVIRLARVRKYSLMLT